MEFEFTLKYKLAEDDHDPADIMERFGEAGCTDTTLGVGIAGRLAVTFARLADSATEAMESAVKDISAILPTATLVEATPDYVSLTDAAEVAGMTRQNLRKLMENSGGSFPSPVHDGSSAGIWRLSDILEWMSERGYTFDESLLELAILARQLNVSHAILSLSVESRSKVLEFAGA